MVRRDRWGRAVCWLITGKMLAVMWLISCYGSGLAVCVAILDTGLEGRALMDRLRTSMTGNAIEVVNR